MNERLHVLNGDASFLDEEYDLIVFPIGYEARSTFIANNARAKAGVGYIFPDGHIHSFAKNLAMAQARNFQTYGGVNAKGSLVESAKRAISGVGDSAKLKILFDVSSFNRRQLSVALLALLEDSFFSGSTITIAYSSAKFRPPPQESAPFLDFSPIQYFEGWTAHPERPTSLVLGLGYDPEQALGAVQYIDPSAIFCFVPIGNDHRFIKAVRKNNMEVFNLVQAQHVAEYQVMYPYQLYWEMSSLVGQLAKQSRVVLVPMGPKIFCAASMVLQRAIGNEVSIWRSSGHNLDNAPDTQPSGDLCCFRVKREVIGGGDK